MTWDPPSFDMPPVWEEGYNLPQTDEKGLRSDRDEPAITQLVEMRPPRPEMPENQTVEMRPPQLEMPGDQTIEMRPSQPKIPDDQTVANLAPVLEQPQMDPAELTEIDTDLDPIEGPSETPSVVCNRESLARLQVRRHVKKPDAKLKEGVREVIGPMSEPPEQFTEGINEMNESFLNDIERKVLKAEEFVAGSLQSSYPAWEELLKESKRQSSEKVLRWIREGVQPTFGGTEKAEPSKLNKVRGLLRHCAVPRGQVEAYLKGELPHKFQNHRSVSKHWPFVVDAAEKLVISGTAHLYGPNDVRPKVVNSLGVALNGTSERLVLNGMYINSFMEQLPFKYERLRDVLTFLGKGGFISSWDLKSGYFHVLIHPRYRTYFGFKIEDAYLHFNGMCFGWSQACYIFTIVMQEMFLEVRARSIPISSYIDDGITADQSYGRCLWAVVLIIRLLNLLGAYFGLPKCHFRPSQEGEWLGFEIVSVKKSSECLKRR
jgi:hypothetical protein